MIQLAACNDFNFIYTLYMHPQVNPFLLYELMDEESFLPIFNKLIEQEIKYIYCSDTQPIGMFKLVPLQHRSHHVAFLGGLAIHPLLSGKGEGVKMMKEIIEFAKRNFFLRIELTVAITNERAIQLYERVGFQREGVSRKCTHLVMENKFIDEIVMSVIF